MYAMKQNKIIRTFITHLWTHIKQWYDKKTIVGGLILPSFVINVLALAFPLVLLQVYDRIIPNESTTTLFLLVLIVIIAILAESFLKIARGLIISWTDARFDYETNFKLFKKILDCDLTKFETCGVGVHLERIRAVNDIKNFYGNQVLTSMLDIPFVFIYLWLIYYIAGALIFVPLFTLIVLLALVFKNANSLQGGIQEKQSSNNRRMNFLVEIFKNIHTVKSLALESFMLRRYERLQDKTSEVNYELSLVNADLQNNTSTISQLTVILVVAFGAISVINGNLTVGGLAACTLLASRVLQPVGRSIGIWHRLGTIKQAEQSIQDLDSLQPMVTVDTPITDKKIQGHLQLNNINIKIENNLLFNNLSIDIKPNEIIAITGANLSGKSTLLSILAGLVKPTSGEVLLDGEPIDHYDPEFLAKHIAYLPQSSVIFSGTVLENITMFRPEYDQRALSIAEKLGLDIIINRLPQGFDTPLGNTVTELLPSGINQLITIARSLLKGPEIILFDEANTTLDLASDNKCQQLLETYKDQATIIMITHRPSYLRLSDRQIEIKNHQLHEVVSL
ncbi:ATP-binding cassette domain-containing protein [Thiotrichales bacterium 19X7-9]|nr:ATP-binding cassette domain-containing protein [Thiotrichales bacterium 19X7-9]